MNRISKKPKKKGILTEKDIDTLIAKGGDVPIEDTTQSSRRIKKTTKKIPVQLRLPQDLLDIIDGIIGNRVVKVSRHAWFLEAIAEKIEKEK